MSNYIKHPDYMALYHGSMEDIVNALKETLHGEDDPVVPAAIYQVAQTLLSKAIFLIRTATASELSTAAFNLSCTMMLIGEDIKEKNQSAYDIINAAELTLANSYQHDSPAGQIATIRDFGNNATILLNLLKESPDHTVAKESLLKSLLFADEKESWHFFSALNQSGLIRLSRVGEKVFVHLGPRASEKYVLEFLNGYGN